MLLLAILLAAVIAFHAPHRLARERLMHELTMGVPEQLRGAVDWDVE